MSLREYYSLALYMSVWGAMPYGSVGVWLNKNGPKLAMEPKYLKLYIILDQ